MRERGSIVPRGPDVAARGSGLAVGLAFSGGLLLSLQVFVLGRLSTHVGSAELAASVNNLVAGVLLCSIGLSTGGFARALRRVRAGARVRPWQLVMGANGGFFVIVVSTVAPKVGVALTTVAIVCGQTLGSLAVDRLALSPAGRRHLTAPRLIGAALALLAVGTSTVGSHHELHVGWLGLAVLAGAGTALQQAAVGHVARATGESFVAGWLNITVGLAVVLTAWLIVTGATAPGGWSAPVEQWLIPGACAAAALVIIAKVVARLGVLRLMLALIAGQSVSALVLDAIAPTGGETVTGRTVAGVALTLLAVALSGLRGVGRRELAELQGDPG
jgi:transporter family-2 protein